MHGEKNVFIQAQEYEDQGKFDLAENYYEQAIKLGIGDLALAHQGRGRSLSRLGYLDDALEECRKALELNPELSLAHGVIGYIYFSQEKYELAEKEFLIAIRLDPNDAISLANLGSTYTNLQRYHEATEIFEKCIQRHPDNLEMRLELVRLYTIRSNFSKAISEFKKIVRSTPTKLKLYSVSYSILLMAIGIKWQQAHSMSRFGWRIGVYLVALFAPTFLSIPVGLLLSFLIFSAILMHLRSKRYQESRILTGILGAGIYCVFYWFLVWNRFTF